MKTINMQNEANVKAQGVHAQKNHKPVVVIETGEVFVSMTDAAAHLETTVDAVSNACRGVQRTVKGYHVCLLSRVTENFDAIVTRLRETAAVEADAKKWQTYQAEQEAIRIVKEKHDAEVAKAKEKVARRQAIRDRIAAQLAEADKNLMDAKKELEALDDEKEVA